MTKFNKGDKVRIINADKIMGAFWTDGEITTVLNVDTNGRPYLKNGPGSVVGLVITPDEFKYLEKVSDKPSKKQRLTDAESEIATLKSQVAELTAEVEALKQAEKPVGINLAEVIAKLEVELTPNEQRKAIIAEAKAFVESAKNFTGNITRRKGYRYQATDNIVCDVTFEVNTKKRVVVALLKEQMGGKYVRAKAIAKCAPDDVFNADIGEAIALGRALGLDVSKFEQAVKPTEVVVGMKIEGATKEVPDRRGERTCYGVFGDKVYTTPTERGWYYKPLVTILDDTEAQY